MAAVIDLANGAAPSKPNSAHTQLFAPSGNGPDGEVLHSRPRAIDQSGNVMDLSDPRLYNYLRNGGFWFAQRQDPTVATTYSSTAGRAFTADGWAVTNENASATYKRVDTLSSPIAGIHGQYYGEFLKITSTGKLVISQVVEALDLASLRGRTARFQVTVRVPSGSATWRMGMAQLTSAGTADTIPGTFVSAFGSNGTDPTLGTNLSYLTPKSGINPDPFGGVVVTGNAVSLPLITTFVRYGVTFDVPLNCKNLVVLLWTDSQIAATTGINIAQASLTDGADIQDWSPQAIGQEYDRVRRFYQKSFTVDQNPIQNIGVNFGESEGITGKAGAVAGAGHIFHRYNPPMRTGGGVTLYNPQAANALMRNFTGAADMGATSTTANTANSLKISATGVAGTAVGDNVAINWTSDAEL